MPSAPFASPITKGTPPPPARARAAGAKAAAGAAAGTAAPAAAAALAEIELPVPLAVCGGAAPNAARAEAELIAGSAAPRAWRAALRHAGVARAAEAELLEIIAEESAGLAPSAAVCAQWRGADRSSLELNGDDFMAVTVGDDEVAVRGGCRRGGPPA